MNKYMKTLVLVGVAASLFGCASPKMNLSVPLEKEITPKPDKALVYFIRPSKLGFAIHAAVYDDETFIGMVPYGQKLPYFASPGPHRYMVVSEAADFLTADLAAGKTYYIEVVPRMGAWRARFSIDPVTKEELQTADVKNQIAKARLIANNQKAHDWATENHPSVLAKKTKYLEKWNAKPDSEKPSLKATDCE